jgi:hypothetical protein
LGLLQALRALSRAQRDRAAAHQGPVSADHGFVERFHRTVKGEFFEPALRETFYESVEALQADLDRWLVHYNTERPHLGYRNMGKRPIDTVNAYLSVTKEASVHPVQYYCCPLSSKA